MKSVLEYLAFGDTERALQTGSVKGGVRIRTLSLTMKSKTPTVSSIDFLKHPGGSLIKVTLFLPQKRIEFSG